MCDMIDVNVTYNVDEIIERLKKFSGENITGMVVAYLVSQTKKVSD